MSMIWGVHRAIAVTACLSAALCLASCGGAAKAPAAGGKNQRVAVRNSQSRPSQQSSSSTAAQRGQVGGTSEARVLSARAAGVTYISRCLEAHGIDVPPQSLSRGFLPKGIDTASPQFKRAYPNCLRGARGVYESMLGH